MSHYIEKCSKCAEIISQCRCINQDNDSNYNIINKMKIIKINKKDMLVKSIEVEPCSNT